MLMFPNCPITKSKLWKEIHLEKRSYKYVINMPFIRIMGPINY